MFNYKIYQQFCLTSPAAVYNKHLEQTFTSVWFIIHAVIDLSLFIKYFLFINYLFNDK